MMNKMKLPPPLPPLQPESTIRTITTSAPRRSQGKLKDATASRGAREADGR